ncbi:hypothetical protein P171DRAFT_436446 [Karstenula rhodostoma CBS 690.94]|uniref:Uncharacterized protein n=1 Tax=Karstenula rhodostoma CBS 690.94 TaxID=1392251 RepID=A0A9P4P9S5_9PLEO|nr:hypothetical protein P171DRAFT_436446 [Karstenula rhodostoma CBS 690.94]
MWPSTIRGAFANLNLLMLVVLYATNRILADQVCRHSGFRSEGHLQRLLRHFFEKANMLSRTTSLMDSNLLAKPSFIYAEPSIF